jgi:hypothetical protein
MVTVTSGFFFPFLLFHVSRGEDGTNHPPPFQVSKVPEMALRTEKVRPHEARSLVQMFSHRKLFTNYVCSFLTTLC